MAIRFHSQAVTSLHICSMANNQVCIIASSLHGAPSSSRLSFLPTLRIKFAPYMFRPHPIDCMHLPLGSPVQKQASHNTHRLDWVQPNPLRGVVHSHQHPVANKQLQDVHDVRSLSRSWIRCVMTWPVALSGLYACCQGVSHNSDE